MPDDVMARRSPRPSGATFRAAVRSRSTASRTQLLAAIADGLGHEADGAVGGRRGKGTACSADDPLPTDPQHSDPTDAVRAAAHEDINLLTVLPASTQPGLELLDRDGHVATPSSRPPDVMICDTGDIFQRLTGGQLPATTHRVVNPPGAANVARYSMPFFVHPRPEWVIRPTRGDAPPITAGAFLEARLREIRVL